MDNYKFTKGNWKIHERTILGVVAENNRMVASTGVYQTNTDNGEHIIENEYNALLISKAPEMLEMLENLRKFGANHEMPYDLYEELDKLIKEATEL